jgi:hypothetical protein
MGKCVVVVAAAAGALWLASCAPTPLTKADVEGTQVCHREKMDQIERDAARAGRQVQWVNCPIATLRVN